MVTAGFGATPRLVLVLSVCAALTGCVAATGPTGATLTEAGASPTAPSPGQRVIERDVEAPEVFQVEDAGLWDGRPSLGGVWVAHPTARDPERVLIRNAATGATVIGALFRRERENPGPRFQVSSEAANALGILPGAPTTLAVTALRLQRVEMELDPAPEPVTAVAETLALAPVTPPPAAAPAPAATPAPAAAPATAPEGQVAITDEPAPRRGLRDLFRRRDAAPDPAITETALAPAATATATATAEVAADVAAAAPDPQPRGLRGLFRRRAAEPEPDTTLIALPDSAATPPAPAAPQAPRPDRPFVQIGIFSVEANAASARDQMRRAGLSAEIRRGRVGENLFWRVVVGPAATLDERASILTRVRGLGFADAYAVVR